MAAPGARSVVVARCYAAPGGSKSWPSQQLRIKEEGGNTNTHTALSTLVSTGSPPMMRRTLRQPPPRPCPLFSFRGRSAPPRTAVPPAWPTRSVTPSALAHSLRSSVVSRRAQGPRSPSRAGYRALSVGPPHQHRPRRPCGRSTSSRQTTSTGEGRFSFSFSSFFFVRDFFGRQRANRPHSSGGGVIC